MALPKRKYADGPAKSERDKPWLRNVVRRQLPERRRQLPENPSWRLPVQRELPSPYEQAQSRLRPQINDLVAGEPCNRSSYAPHCINRGSAERLGLAAQPRRSGDFPPNLEELAALRAASLHTYCTQPDDGSKDVFVHISAVECAELHGLNEGQTVSFDVVADRRTGKSSAENLRAL